MTEQTNRPKQLIDALGLTPHPEGGHFGEVFRSPQGVTAHGPEVQRQAMTTIYFLLDHPEFSCWHVVNWDELWHHYEGSPLEHLTIDPSSMVLQRRLLGVMDGDQRPVLSVPAGYWQAARPVHGYTLAGCTVGPGFEFEDMNLLRDDAEARELLTRHFPDYSDLL